MLCINSDTSIPDTRADLAATSRAAENVLEVAKRSSRSLQGNPSHSRDGDRGIARALDKRLPFPIASPLIQISPRRFSSDRIALCQEETDE
jgi:hypothetical protein